MGGVKAQTLQYNGATWTLNNLDADRGTEVLARIGEIVGGPFGELIASALKHGTLRDAPKEDVARSLATLMSNLHRSDARGVIKILLTGLHRSPAPDGGLAEINFAQYFASNYKELLRLTGWALEINFKDFFDGFTSLLGGDPMTLLASLRSPPTPPKA